jgi:hypothetical protein
MELNPEAWPELIFSFGPYAILILFILWVVPRTSKRMQNITETAPKAVRVSATAALVVSWGVVLLMVGYVLFKWSPVRVYPGELGVLDQAEKIYPLDDNIYVKVEGTAAPRRERWHFVVVDRERALRKESTADFTYFWGEKDDEYTDFLIPIDSILDGDSRDFRFDRKDPEKSYVWSQGGWQLATREVPQQPRVAINFNWNAWADSGADLEQIRQRLASPNRLVRAKARNRLRKLNNKQLQALKAATQDARALHQIGLELQRRQR